jgi:pyridinium-3,5-bisthiocarboxylic acid mononucleotide nickel chelatase
MQVAYLDCASGVSGDMLLGALIDAGVDLGAIQAGIDSLGLTGCRLVTEEVNKRGFRALQLTVQHEPEHVHRHLADIRALIAGSCLSASQQDLAQRIFLRLARAEAKVHGATIEQVHFHEVGAVDSIADIVGTVIAWDLLGADRLVSAPIPTGTGFIQIAHGRCSIPAPATGELLQGIPLAASDVEGELTTPTGAAIVGTLADAYGPLPAMTIDRIGYGAGQADFKHPNLLRLIVGAATPAELEPTRHESSGSAPAKIERVILLETNLDDTTGEQVGYCQSRLWQSGALDVATTPLQMKKGRPGLLLRVQCRPEDAARLQEIIFDETTTLGLRRSTVERLTLQRRSVSVATPWGEVAGIVASLPDGRVRFAPEYEICAQVAEEAGLPLADVYAAARLAYAGLSVPAASATSSHPAVNHPEEKP